MLRARLKTFVHFGEGVCVAHLVRHRGFDEFHAHFADRAATIALVAGRLLGTAVQPVGARRRGHLRDPVLLPEKVRKARQVLTCTAHNKARLTFDRRCRRDKRRSRSWHTDSICACTSRSRGRSANHTACSRSANYERERASRI